MSRRSVGIAEAGFGRTGDVLATVGLGSCIALALHDREGRAGALAHVLLPSTELSRQRDNPVKFADTVLPHLLARLRSMGARPEQLGAFLVGGASMFTALLRPGARSMGARNVDAAREALHRAGIPLLGEETGGEQGRSLRFEVGGGRLVVTSAFRERVVLHDTRMGTSSAPAPAAPTHPAEEPQTHG